MNRVIQGIYLLIALAFVLHPGAAQAGEVDWLALNPDLEGAVLVEDTSVCAYCHANYLEAFSDTKHARVLGDSDSCQSCHGPLSKHLASPMTKPLPMVSFSPEAGLTPKEKASVCLQCHEGTDRTYWHGGAHEASGVSCDSCHYIAERRSDHGLGINENATDSCLTCHLEKRGQALKSAHMPVREGKMECTSCHNPHGSYGPKLLNAATSNEVCYDCHAEKRGPFLWEHAPVRENCSTCHDTHGSNNPGMLKIKGAFLCLTCHQYGGHVNVPRYSRSSSTIGQGCINCHSRIHGSNHPSGAKLTR